MPGIEITRRQPFREELERLVQLLDAIRLEVARTPNPWFGQAPLERLQLLLVDRVKEIFKYDD